MAISKEKSSMRFPLLGLNKKISTNFKKTLWYYTGFCLLFFVLHLALVSLVAFFHFLLDHDIAVIEIWINENSWELLVISKLIAFFIFSKVIQLNLDPANNLKEIMSKLRFLPDLKGTVLILFFSLLYPALLNVFEIQLIPVGEWEFSHFQIASFIGNIFFYLLDFFLIVYLVMNLKLRGKTNRFLLFFCISFIFLIVSRVVIPYSSESIFLFMHLLSLFTLFHRGMRNLGNILLYSVLCIGAFAVLYGVDPVWAKTYSLYSVTPAPIFPLLVLWLMGFVYYLKR